uniref:Uncharacterized protein n=1 Tax=Arundo donax TaxID=35708 RepID=A0A0A8YCC7_ARUDO
MNDVVHYICFCFSLTDDQGTSGSFTGMSCK